MPSSLLESPVQSRRQEQAQQSPQEQGAAARRTAQVVASHGMPAGGGGALLPTRAQAELAAEASGSTSRVAGGRREEPRSVEEAGPLRVLYEGHDLLIVDKPPDVRMQGPFDVTVETLVRHWCPQAAPPSLGLKWIHQLDYATSGVLCIGLSRRMAAAAGDLFARRVVAKEYVALLEGHLDPASLPLRGEEEALFCCSGDEEGARAGHYDEASLPGIKLEARRPQHKIGVIYKPAPSFYRDKQLAAQRKEKEEGTAALTPTEAAVLATKWRDARTALPEVAAACEALAAADKARAAAAAAAKARQEGKEEEEEEAGTSEEDGGGAVGSPGSNSGGSDGGGGGVRSPRAPTTDLGAFRRPRDPAGSFVVDVAITELKHEFRVRLGLPSPSPSTPTPTPATPTKPDPAIYTTGPRRARTLGRVVARGYLTLPGEQRAVTKVVLRPVTGRRHQLRVHTLYMAHPIVGDTTYTGDTAAPRMMLHAASLSLPFPPNKGPGCTISVATEADPFAAYFRPL